MAAVLAILEIGHLRSSRTYSPHAQATASPSLNPEQRNRILARVGELPLAFEKNQGQTDSQVQYVARGSGYTAFLTASDTVLAVNSEQNSAPNSRRAKAPRSAGKKTAVIDMRLVGGSANPQIVAGDPLPGTINYYSGSDPQKWQTGVKQYSSVRYQDVYPGVSMVFHGAQRQLEFDFVVSQGADPALIDLGFAGAQKVATDASGNLVLTSSAGDVLLHKPVASQEKNGSREMVDAAFQLSSKNEVTLRLGAYDHARELVIDPSLTYSTYLGGSGEDEAFAIAVDASGNVYVAGQMASINFPAHSGTVSNIGGFDAFVTKIDSAGSTLDFTTLLNGSSDDAAIGVAVAGSAVYVVGNTVSANFPSTKTLGSGGGQDAFVASLNSTSGATNYVTRVGGTGTETANAIAVDSSGNAYIGGQTDSTNFPTATPLQSSNGGTDDGFVAKINSSGSALVFSTYLGGSSGDLVTGVALDSSNNVYVTGITVSTNFPTTTGAFQTAAQGADDSFVAEIKSDGSALTYSTYFGGSGADDALAIAVDSGGEAYITGNTTSSDLPTANPAQKSNAGGNDVFVSKLNSTGTALVFSTYYGGSLDETGTGIALDAFGDAYVTGRTSSSTYPTSGSPFQSSLSGTSDAFVTEFSNTGFVEYSSFLGGTGNENSIAADLTQGAIGAVAVDSSSNAYIAGDTNSTTGFPITGGIQSNYAGGLADAFVAKVGAAPADFSVAVSPSSTSTTAGQTTSDITVTVSSVNSSFGQSVALSCGGLPSKAVCHFSNASVTPTGTAATSTLTISTNGSSSASIVTQHRGIFAAMLLPMLGMIWLNIYRPTRRKNMLGTLAIGLVLMALLALPACGGSSGGGGGGGGNTPPGTYNLTVSGSGGGATHGIGLTLTVN
jgi:hypothetical protein